MAIGKNIRDHREKRLQITLEELSNMSGVDVGTISALEIRDSSRSKFFGTIAKALNISVEELEMPYEKWESKQDLSNYKSEALDKNEITITQYHDAVGAMGKGLVLRGETGQITGWKVTKDWINNNVPLNTGNKNLVIVTGFGDSMKGMFNSGDPLIVDIGVKTLDYDGVYFFRIGDEGFIKTLQRIPGKGINVISENKKYESWTIKKDMEFEVLGRVLKVWKSEEF